MAIVELSGGRGSTGQSSQRGGTGLRDPSDLALPAALTCVPAWRCSVVDRAREQRALSTSWRCGPTSSVSPRISFEPSLLLLEIGASLRLFGGLPRLLDTVQRNWTRSATACSTPSR